MHGQHTVHIITWVLAHNHHRCGSSRKQEDDEEEEEKQPSMKHKRENKRKTQTPSQLNISRHTRIFLRKTHKEACDGECLCAFILSRPQTENLCGERVEDVCGLHARTDTDITHIWVGDVHAGRNLERFSSDCSVMCHVASILVPLAPSDARHDASRATCSLCCTCNSNQLATIDNAGIGTIEKISPCSVAKNCTSRPS